MMKKKFAVAAFLSFFSVFSVFSQAAVIDVSAIAAAIENGYTMYQQLQSAYESYKKAVETAEKIEKAATKLKGSDLSVLKAKALDLAQSKVDEKLDNLKDMLDEKMMDIGGMKLSLKDLYTTDAWSKVLESYDGLTEDDILAMSTEEEREKWAKNGISPKNALLMKKFSEEFNKTAQEAGARIKLTDGISESMRDFATAASDSGLGGEGQVELLQQQVQTGAQSLKVASLAYDVLKDQAKMSLAMFSKDNVKEKNESDTRDAYERGSEFSAGVEIQDDSEYLGPSRSR